MMNTPKSKYACVWGQVSDLGTDNDVTEECDSRKYLDATIEKEKQCFNGYYTKSRVKE